MAKAKGKSLHQLSGEATRYAEFYFDPVYRMELLEQEGCAPDADYAALILNRFVPIDWVPGSAAVLRKFVRGGGNALDAGEMQPLEEYWRELESGAAALSKALEAGDPTASVKAAAQAQQTWPAVGVCGSEVEMRSLLTVQFETIRQNGIEWRCVDSSTYCQQKPDGIFVVADWFWHGF